MDKVLAGLSARANINPLSTKPAGSKNNPLQMQKEFGDKKLEDILNEAADPNYQANKRRIRGVGNTELDKDAFFKLMMTQLKQQDPTNPLKSHEMAAQLAQFSSVEQLSNINQTLTKMDNKGDDKQLEILNLIGKEVQGDSAKIDRLAGDKEHTIEFQLDKAADAVSVEIKDTKGIVVKKYDLKDLKQVKNRILWNGQHSDGRDATVGQYSAEIVASNKGQKVSANTKFQGKVDGVQFSSKGPMLKVDGKSLSLRDVKTIQLPQISSNSEKADVIRMDKESSKGAIEEKKPMANLEAANMDSSLREKFQGIAKNTAKGKYNSNNKN